MKRKFPLSIAPISVPSKQETRALKESLAKRDISTPASPFVNRRILSPQLESELRAACEAVLNEDGNSYGAAAALQAQETRLDLQSLQQSMRAMEQAQQQSGHRRAGSHPLPDPLPRRGYPSQETTARLPSHAFSYKPEAPLGDLFPDQGLNPVQANTSRRREAHVPAYDKSSRSVSGRYREQQHDHTTGRQAAYDRPSTAPIGRGLDSPDTNYSTPLSASTMDNHRNYASTAMTSAEPSRASKRNSHHLFSDEDAASRADAAASTWMRQEYERRNESDVDGRLSRRMSRAGSVTRSIKSEIKEYFRPGSSGVSRVTSRESLGSRGSDATTATQAPVAHGWRSWSLQRKPSERSLNSRSSSTRGCGDARSKEGKEINLNRELPPLPSLDQWKEPEKKEDAPAHFVPVQKPTSPTHIANLMQTPPKVRPRREHIAHQHADERRQRRLQDASRRSPGRAQMRPGVRGVSSDPEVPMHFQPRTEDSLARDLAQSHEIMSIRYGSSSEAVNRSSPSLVDSGHSRDEGYQGHKPSMKISIDHFNGEPPNFSKKIRSERAAQQAGQEQRYKNKAEIKANNTLASRSSSNVKGLKRMFSHFGLGGKREKKETWMDKFEKNGVKGGVLVHDEAAGAPVVRY